MKNNKLLILLVSTLIFSPLFGANITFSGGFTKVSLQDNNHVVTLSENALVQTDDVKLKADSITLHGKDYSYVTCSGQVSVEDTKNNVTLSCVDLFYDRNTDTIMSNGWISIDDNKNGVKLCSSWLEFNIKTTTMILQIKATIDKDTSSGHLLCSADSITYNADNQTLTLKGNAKITWGEDSYNASLINVDIDSEDISLHGSISGEVHGD